MVKLIKRVLNKLKYLVERGTNRVLLSLKVYPNVLDSHQSIQNIVENEMSVSRVGCGEISVMRGSDWGFQKYDEKLVRRMIEVLNSPNDPKIAICIPDVFRDRSRLSDYATRFWHNQVSNNLLQWNKFTTKNKLYYDALFTRFYMDLEDKVEFPQKSLELLKKVWNDKDLLIIEGSGSRLGYQNDLFSNSKSIQRILCPAESAFDKYDEILETTQQHAKDKLVLIALGMTATVLSYDLAQKGFRAIDIGHIDAEYEWFRMKATKKVALKYRYLNEVNAREIEEIKDDEFNSQVIAKID
ncbi:MAG: SP_1767 family glycosyltransferase [Flavobacterium sp.]